MLFIFLGTGVSLLAAMPSDLSTSLHENISLDDEEDQGRDGALQERTGWFVAGWQSSGSTISEH